MKKSYLLYGKNTYTLITIEFIVAIILVIVGIIWMLFTNIFVLLLMILCASFFFIDAIKKNKFKVTLSSTTIVVENDELPLTKKIQYYNKIEYKDITNIYIESDKLNSKNEKIKNYIYSHEKQLTYLTLQCNKTKNRIFVSYLTEVELIDMIDTIITNINNISNKKINITGQDIVDDFVGN